MRKIKLRYYLLLLISIFILSIGTYYGFTSNAAIKDNDITLEGASNICEGKIGNIEMSYNQDTRKMTLSGSGGLAVKLYQFKDVATNEVESLEIGGNIRSIGNNILLDGSNKYVFTNLKEIKVGSSVKKIYEGAFNLARVERYEAPFVGIEAKTDNTGLPIGTVFNTDNPDFLREVIINDEANQSSYLNKDSFKGAIGLVSLRLNKLAEIDKEALSGATNLRELYLDCGIAPAGALSKNVALESLAIRFASGRDGSSLPFGALFGEKRADYSGFINQVYKENGVEVNKDFLMPKGLKRVSILDGDLEYGVFSNCLNIRMLTLPSGSRVFDDMAFLGFKENTLQSLYFNGSEIDFTGITFKSANSNPLQYASTVYMKRNGVYIPATDLDLSGVSEIGDYQFYNYKGLMSLSNFYPKTIGSYAFSGCSNLSLKDYRSEDYTYLDKKDENNETIKIEVGENAFKDCIGLGRLLIHQDNDLGFKGCGYSYELVTNHFTDYEGNNKLDYFITKDGTLYINGTGVINENKDILTLNGFEKTNINELIIGNKISGIKYKDSFGLVNVKKLTIGKNVEAIEAKAFEGFDNLNVCYFLNDFKEGIQANFLPKRANNNDSDANYDLLSIYVSSGARGWDSIHFYDQASESPFKTDKVNNSDYNIYLSINKEATRVIALDKTTFVDIQGLIYTVALNNNKSVYVSGFSANNSINSDLTIPRAIKHNQNTYNVIGVKENALNNAFLRHVKSLTIASEVMDIKENAFVGLTGLEALFYNIPNDRVEAITGYTNSKNLSLIIDEGHNLTEANKSFLANNGISLFISSNINSGKLKYTLDRLNHRAIVGDIAEEAKGSMNHTAYLDEYGSSDVFIPDFISDGSNTYRVIGFSRNAFTNSEVKTISFGAFIGDDSNDGFKGIYPDTFKGMNSLEKFIVRLESRRSNHYLSDKFGILYSLGREFNMEDGSSIRAKRALIVPQQMKANGEALVFDRDTAIIDNDAFSGNENSYTVDLSNINIIGKNAFRNCKNITFRLGDAVYYVGSGAFYNSSINGNINGFINRLLYIGDDAFNGDNITGDIYFNDKVSYIGYNAFSMTNIGSFNINNNSSYKTIDGVLFLDDGERILLQYPTAKSDKKYDMSSLNVSSISSYAFYGNSHLNEVILSDITKTIGGYAFANMSSLYKIYLGKDYYGDKKDKDDSNLFTLDLFKGSYALKEIKVNGLNPSFKADLSGALYSKDYSILYYYPGGLDFSQYKLNSNTTKIYSHAFSDNRRIEQVITYDLIDEIGTAAFMGCSNLKEIYFSTANRISVGDKIFQDTNTATNGVVVRYYHDSFKEQLVNDRFAGAKAVKYEVIEYLPNDRVKADEYLVYIIDSNGKPLNECQINIYVNGSNVAVSKNTLAGNYGVFALNELDKKHQNGVFTVEDVILEVIKEKYITYKQALSLDMDLNVTYITLYKEDVVAGISCNGSSINAEAYEINLKDYNDTYSFDAALAQNSKAKALDLVDSKPELIEIKAARYSDTNTDKPGYLYQNNIRLDVEPIVTFDKFNNNGHLQYVYTYTFMVDPSLLLPDLDIYFKSGSDTDYKEVKLNIGVISFTLDSDDIDLNTGDLTLDFNNGNGDSSLLSLMGNLFGGEFNITLGKNVKMLTMIDGNRITLSIDSKWSHSKEIDTYKDPEEGYNESTNKHGKNTYYFRYDCKLYERNKEGNLGCELTTYHIVIRFTKSTVKDGISYYRLNVYSTKNGKSTNDVIHTIYGRVNVKSNLRSEFSLKSKYVFADFIGQAMTLYHENVKDSAKKFNVTDIKNGVVDPMKKLEYNNSHNLEVGLSGEITFEYVKNKGLTMLDGNVTGTIGYVLEHNSQLVIIGIPINVNVGLDVYGKLTFDFTFDPSTIISPEALLLEMGMDLNARVGIGCRLLSAGIYGNLGTVIVIDLMKPNVNSWEVHGEFGVYFKVLWFQHELELFKGKHYFVGSEESKYISNSPAKMYLAHEYKAYDPLALDEKSEILIIDGKIYKLHFKNLSQRAGYDKYNYRKLALSYFTEGMWKELSIIDDNGLNDASYFISEDNGEYSLVFTQAMRRLNEKTANDTYSSASNMEIKYLSINDLINTKKSNPEGVYRSEAYKYHERIELSNGKLTIAWVENSDNNIFGVSPDNYVTDNNEAYSYKTTANSIYVATFENGKWIKKLAKDNLSAITDLSLTKDGVVSFIEDKDSDLSTTIDRGLSYINISDLKLSSIEGDGILSLDSFDGETIYYYENEKGSGFKYADLNYNATIDLPINVGLSNSYKLLKDNTNKLRGILYSKNEEFKDGTKDSVGSALYLISYDSVTNKWGGEIKIRNARADRYILSFSAAIIDNDLFTSISYGDKDGKKISNESYNIPLESNVIVSDNYDIDYKNRVVAFDVTNSGALAEVINIKYGSLAKEVRILPGINTTVSINLNSENIQHVEIKTNKNINSYDINMEYVSLSMTSKQGISGDNNDLLLQLKNSGNTTSNGTIYVFSGIVKADSNNIEGLKSLAKASLSYSGILAGESKLISIKLDYGLINSSSITIFADDMKEPEGLKYDNLINHRLADYVEPSMDSSLEYNIAYYDINDISVKYSTMNGYRLDRILDSNNQKVEYLDSNNTITFKLTHLQNIHEGLNSYKVIFKNDNYEEIALEFNIYKEYKYRIKYITSSDGGYEEVKLLKGTPIDKNYVTMPDRGIIGGKEIFVGWDMNGDGIADNLGNATRDLVLKPVYKRVLDRFMVSWVLPGRELKEYYSYGDTIKFKGMDPSYLENGVYYTFKGFDINNDGKVDSMPKASGNLKAKAIFDAVEHVHNMTYHGRVEATATRAGNVEYYTCDHPGCENTYYADIEGKVVLDTIIIPKLNTEHNYKLVEHKDPTCQNEGYDKYVCEVCNEVKIVAIPKLEHEKTMIIEDKYLKSEATCLSPAIYYYACSICGNRLEETFEYKDKLPHSYNDFYSVDDDYHKHICRICGTEEVLEHNYDEGEEKLIDGIRVMVYTCKDCKHVKYVNLDHVHSYGEYIDFDDTNHKRVCECGDTIYEPHNYGEKEVVDSEHEKYICKDCGHVYIKYTGKPIIIEGDNSHYDINKDNMGLSLRPSFDKSSLIEIMIDTRSLSSEEYTFTDGVITIKDSVLRELSGGSHVITLLTSGGSCRASLTIDGQNDLEALKLGLIIGGSSILVIGAIAGIAVLLVRRGKRNAYYVN